MPAIEDVESRAFELAGAIAGIATLLEAQSPGQAVPAAPLASLMNVLAREAEALLPGACGGCRFRPANSR